MFKIKKKNLTHVASLVLLLLLLSSAIPTLRSPLLNIFEYPLGLLRLLQREIKGVIFYHRNLVQNENLHKEIGLLRQRLNAVKEEGLENKRMRDLLSLKQRAPYKVITARIIGRSPDNWASLAIIDKGRDNGVRQGYVVIGYYGLVGRIIEASRSTSKAMLINDPNLGVSAIVQRSRQEGLVSGTLGSSLIMKYLPKDADIKPTDSIITSGLSDIYPKGLVIGSVIAVGDEFSGLSRYAVIKPAVNLSNIEEVLVIIP